MRKPCSFHECDKPVNGWGLCNTHQRQIKRGEELSPIKPRFRTRESQLQRIEDQIVQFTDKSGGVAACWPWLGRVNVKKYGTIWIDGQHRPAHRVLFERTRGPIPAGMTLDHTCHNRDPHCPGALDCLHRRCVNPWHMDTVTKAENNRRKTDRRLLRR